MTFAKLSLIAAALVVLTSAAEAQAAKDTTKKPAARRWYDTTTYAPKDTAWVASKKGHTYYLAGCTGSLTLTPKNVITFKTEADAKAAGFTHSKQRGC